MKKVQRKRSLVYFAFSLLVAGSSLLLNSCNKTVEYPGYKLIEKRFVKEVNSDVYFFEHIKSGARVVKIASDDPNKTFSIAFKTEPETDGGTPHIIEHSVLNGSKNFPCKSPFDELSKGSLKTFLNAFTGSDMTAYPFASMNNKDYFNLMNVYLDAVFYPAIYTDPRIFKQEGWHYELEDEKSPIVYKGVVYNEMKGAFSNPERELGLQIGRNLFPDNGYKYSSGGYPVSIPSLTYEQFVDFHKRHYSPSNSYIYLYGNADMGKELHFIDSAYLANFEKSSEIKEIQIQKPFDKMKEVVGEYPAMDGSDTKNLTYLTLNWVIGKNTNQTEVTSLQILSEVLVNQESAPIRLALEKAGIGQDIYSYVDNTQQNVFNITVLNADPEDKDKFKEIVMNTLKEVSEKGIDKQAIEGTINRMEFKLREGSDAQKGINIIFNGLGSWMFSQDPFVGLEWEKPLKEVKTALTTNFLEEKIKTGMLQNNHSLLLVLSPKPGFEKEINEKTAKELADYKSKLTKEQIATLIKETKDLKEYQQKEDSPEALAKVPSLTLKDVNPKAEWYPITEKESNGTKVLQYESFTNNIVYTNLMFDLKAVPQELLPYSSLLSDIMGMLNTENYTFGDLDKALNINTGRFNTSISTWCENDDDSKLITKFIVNSKSMNDKNGKMFELASEIINKTKYNDKDKLKTVLTRIQSQFSNNVKENGMSFSIVRSQSYYSNKGMFKEITKGFEYYWFLNEIVKNFDKDYAKTIANLEKTSKLLFTSKNMIAATTCNNDDYKIFSENLNKFTKTLSQAQPSIKDFVFELKKKNEGFLSSSKVQYVVKANNFKKQGYKWSGKMMVLNSVISGDWLQNRIRVLGGAYGGFAGITSDGNIYFGSYRDPNLKETLDNYDATPNYLKTFKADNATMLKYIIGTIADLDNPMTIEDKGFTGVALYLKKTTFENYQAQRDEVLSTTVDDIKNFEPMISSFLKQNTFVVYGNKEKIESNKKLFDNVLNLEKI